jgi:ferredoxin
LCNHNLYKVKVEDGNYLMITLTIDGKPAQVPEGTTILDAAESLGIKIPTLCFIKDLLPITSCMLCIVKVEGRKNLVPACATKAEEGMVVFNNDPDVISARRTALELLLSDHVGDCMGPCQVACPAGMNIPEMIRYMAAGKYDKAIETIKDHIALPAVTGYICPAPCEKACRRGQVDEPIAVRLIKRCAAEMDLAGESPYQPTVSTALNKKVAIAGAGPAGLSAAYYLQRAGVSCTVFDDREAPGGMLRYGVPEEELPRSILEKEIEQISDLGVIFRQQVRIGKDLALEELLKSYNAVFLGIGKVSAEDLEMLGFAGGQKTLSVDQNTFETDIPGVFAGGDVRKGLKLTVRSLADGKKAAISILQFLNGEPVTGSGRPFNARMGKLEPEELKQLSIPTGINEQSCLPDPEQGLTPEQATNDSANCLHCDCRKKSACKLRIFADEYGAKATQYRGKRRSFEQKAEHPDLICEPRKCISCGICVRITEKQKEELGLTFIGRGFDVKVAVPFDKSIKQGLLKTAREVVNACPTGALAFKESKD